MVAKPLAVLAAAVVLGMAMTIVTSTAPSWTLAADGEANTITKADVEELLKKQTQELQKQLKNEMANLVTKKDLAAAVKKEVATQLAQQQKKAATQGMLATAAAKRQHAATATQTAIAQPTYHCCLFWRWRRHCCR